MPYELVVILKGFEGPAPEEKVFPGARFLRISDEGYDITAYRHAAGVLEQKRLCFVNSHSEILADGWLAALSDTLDQPDCGIAGATGSWEHHDASAPAPNVHIRTNGFMLEREAFLSADFGPLQSKRDSNRFEAGPNGLTRQVFAQGLAPRVVLTTGAAEPDHWPGCRGFRSWNQEHLLIADNRTRAYQSAWWPRRKKLARLAFQDAAMPARRPFPDLVAQVLGRRL